MSQSQWCSQCGVNEHKFSCKCSSAADDSSSDGSGIGADEIMLFGVRVKVDPMRKSVSMNNLSQYEQPASEKRESSNNNFDGSVAAADNGYASADDALRIQSNGTRGRKRGIPWSEDEHKLFLIGLQKIGKGDWRGISRNFVKTRTPTQVASHAQKYFLRRSNLNRRRRRRRRRRRSSLFDITTDSVAALPIEENQVNKDKKGQALVQPSLASSHSIFSINGGSTLLVHPTPNQSTRMDPNINRKYETDPLSVSLNLSLSFNPDRSSSSYQVISGFNNGDSMISVN